MLLSLAGGVAGLLIAYWGVPALVAVLPQSQLNAMPFLKSLNLNAGILAFSFRAFIADRSDLWSRSCASVFQARSQ